jgi:hypothetical protein
LWRRWISGSEKVQIKSEPGTRVKWEVRDGVPAFRFRRPDPGAAGKKVAERKMNREKG